MPHAAGTEIDLLFIRHAATAWTTLGRYQGRRDPALSDEGRIEAAELAQRVAHEPIDIILTSPLTRAVETARAVSAINGARLLTDDRLIELSYGRWEGLTQPEIKARWPDDLRRWKRFPHAATPTGGEALPEAMARLHSLLQELPGCVAGCRVAALMTHDILIRLALLAASGKGLEGIRDISVQPASVHRLRLTDGVVRTTINPPRS